MDFIRFIWMDALYNVKLFMVQFQMWIFNNKKESKFQISKRIRTKEFMNWKKKRWEKVFGESI